MMRCCSIFGRCFGFNNSKFPKEFTRSQLNLNSRDNKLKKEAANFFLYLSSKMVLKKVYRRGCRILPETNTPA